MEGKMKGKFFGGFHRQDVTEQVAEVAMEVIQLRAEVAALTSRLKDTEKSYREAEDARYRVEKETREDRELVARLRKLHKEVQASSGKGLSREHLLDALARATDPRHDAYTGVLTAGNYCNCESCFGYRERKKAARDAAAAKVAAEKAEAIKIVDVPAQAGTQTPETPTEKDSPAPVCKTGAGKEG